MVHHRTIHKKPRYPGVGHLGVTRQPCNETLMGAADKLREDLRNELITAYLLCAG
jgi:hypothetical protein